MMKNKEEEPLGEEEKRYNNIKFNQKNKNEDLNIVKNQHHIVSGSKLNMLTFSASEKS